MSELTIGFVGQGWIGKNYADDFEKRGFRVVRYSLEEPYRQNKDLIKSCDFVFIAVPTPTSPTGFDLSIVEAAIELVGEGKVAVIKSTIIPGSTNKLAAKYPSKLIIHSPEFLTEATAAYDAANPARNILGLPEKRKDYDEAAATLMSILAKAKYELICSALEAEFIKYGRNALGYFRIIFTNLLYEAAIQNGADWEPIRAAMSADPDNGPTYMNALHKTGRGAGGHCFIKDYAAFARYFADQVNDPLGLEVLKVIEKKNIALLKSTNKDLNYLAATYGDQV
jgi:nucleotide sugar dehydrogenase